MDRILPISPPPSILIKDASSAWNWEAVEKEIGNLTWDDGDNFSVSNSKQFFDSPALTTVRQTIISECEAFVKHVCPIDFSFNLTMTSSWVNKMQQGNSHPWHSHPFSVVSGTIFLDDTPDNLNLTFKQSMKDAVPPYSILDMDYYTSIKDLSEPNDNLQHHMVLFYSNTMHSVPPLQLDVTRRTVSFNTFWTGPINFGDELNSHNFK